MGIFFEYKEYLYEYFWNEHVTCNDVVWSVSDVTCEVCIASEKGDCNSTSTQAAVDDEEKERRLWNAGKGIWIEYF